MPLDPQVIEIYKNKPAPPDKYILEDMRKNADAVFNDKTEIIAVSYTHLDVYKRQGTHSLLVALAYFECICKSAINIFKHLFILLI